MVADDSFSVVPSGRLFLDGAALFTSDKENFHNGVAVPEIWLGAKMNYKKWIANIYVAFNNNKVGLRAVYLGYNFNENLQLKLGSFLPQYGLRTTLSATNLAPLISPMSNIAFNDGRQLGAMLVYYPGNFLAAGTIHTEGEAATSILGSKDFVKEGIGVTGRFAFRPVHNDGQVVQLGLSGGFSTPRRHLDENGMDLHDAFEFKANFPTRVVTVRALDALVDHATGKWKFSPELLLNYKFLALESQYYFSTVTREVGYRDFSGQGMYVILRGLLNGNSYSYASYAGVLDAPAPKSLECVLGYNYTDLSDRRSEIMGGQASNFSLTLNYYFNKYVTARLRYGYTHVWNREGYNPTTLNSVMARIQVIF
ncbi:MAG: ATPase [Muribaculaceae bacterium]|nr:ATPase [Muribaculaceae bacterium]